MKKLLILFSAAFCILIASCSKDSGFMPGSDLSSSIASQYHSNSPIIIVPPTGGDDTENLVEAINNAEPGTVIKLTAGDYHLNYIEITEFHGSIVGAGPARTFIYPVTPLNYKVQFNQNIVPCWMRFTGGEICISNMTISSDVNGPIHDYSDEPYMGEDLFAILVFADYNDKHRPEDPFQKVTVKNVNIIGGSDEGTNGYMTSQNTIEGIWCGSDFWWPVEGREYPLTKGEFSISDSYFSNFLDAVEGFGLGEYATMKVSNCSLNNCLWPLYFTANHGPRVYILNNIFSKSIDSDVIIEDIDWGILSNTYINPNARSQFTLTGNTFNVQAATSSVILWDTYVATVPDKVPAMMINMKSNVFNLVEGSTGINAINSQEAVIRNNIFRGSCINGIVVDGIQTDRYGTPLPLEIWANKVLIIGNNFTGLNSTTADIWFGPKSMNCTVIGNGKESVLDEGTGNKVVGMKIIPGGSHIGPRIRENFHMWPRGRQH